MTDQDRLIHALCRPERLIELARQFIVYDEGGTVKKVARYQQYFTVRETIARIRQRDTAGRRKGGVVWHTQGSGKSLTMVMLGKALALADQVPNPRIVLVTDRVDLDEQIWKTFHQCGKEPVQAKTGRHLVELLADDRVAVITTVLEGRTHDAPAALHERDLSRALYGALKEQMGDTADVSGGVTVREDSPSYQGAERPSAVDALLASAACKLEDIIRKHAVVRWRENVEAQNRMRNDMDDFLFALQEEKSVKLTIPQMDAIIESSLRIARNRPADV